MTGHELAGGGGLDVGDDRPRPGCRWRPRARRPAPGRSVTWAGSTPTLTTSVGANSGAPDGVGDRRPVGQAPGEHEVLPLPQLRVHERRLGDDLPAVVALAQVAGVAS